MPVLVEASRESVQNPTPATPPSENIPPVTPESHDKPAPASLRRSGRTRTPVDRFQFTPANGYLNTNNYPAVQRFVKQLIKSICLFSTLKSNYGDVAYLAALAMDHEYGILDQTDLLPPDYFTRNPFMFKEKSNSDPYTPSIREALSGDHRDDFIDCMRLEIEELEGHGTWDVIRHKDIKPVTNPDGTTTVPKIIPSTWAFKIKRYPDGLLRKLKARFCARGDLQDDVFLVYAPVASWTSIRMLTIMSLQKKWKTKQIDFANAFVHAPIDRDVFVSLPAMFGDTSGIDDKELCLKLNKSLYGLKDAPQLWADYLAKGLDRCGFVASDDDPGVFLGRGMAIVTYVDDVLFFGPDEDEMEKGIDELQSDGFRLKREKNGDDSV